MARRTGYEDYSSADLTDQLTKYVREMVEYLDHKFDLSAQTTAAAVRSAAIRQLTYSLPRF